MFLVLFARPELDPAAQDGREVPKTFDLLISLGNPKNPIKSKFFTWKSKNPMFLLLFGRPELDLAAQENKKVPKTLDF